MEDDGIVSACPIMAAFERNQRIHDVPSTSNTSAISLTSENEDHVPRPFESERLPVTLTPEIQRFLRVANLIEQEEPRVAYICRLHVLIIAQTMDRDSEGRGVRQFKTSLLKRLKQDDEITKEKRKVSDIRELRRVYQAYNDYIIKNGKSYDLVSRGKLIYARSIVSVLGEVLKAIVSPANLQGVADRNLGGGRSEFDVPYNILPLDNGGIQHAIMQLSEIKAAVSAIRNIRGLPLDQEAQKQTTALDLFVFLQGFFGFQKGNVANQREHLILLLANIHNRRSHKSVDVAVDELMKKFFKNYTNWRKFLNIKSSIRLPKDEGQQYKLLYLGLHLLIWGEAANLRFMPECLCYIFHHMAHQLHGILTGAIASTEWDTSVNAVSAEPESFLNKIVCPIYQVIHEEAEKSKNGTADHSTWRNYDDLNEFFWSPNCFELGWPMNLHHDFFYTKLSDIDSTKKPQALENTNENERNNEDACDEELGSQAPIQKPREAKWLGKTNFVEVRSFWQIFRSFDRMWSFFILALQAMIIMASHDLESPIQLFEKGVFENVMSIFITSSVLKLIQAILDIIFTWKTRHTMDISQKKRQYLNVGVAVIWMIILPTCYATSRKKYTCYSTKSRASWAEELCISPYMVSVAIYLTSNAIKMVLFFVPAVSKYIEVSNWRFCMLISWWLKSGLFVGRGMQERQVSQMKYALFWILVLSSKFSFSYFFEIKPLIAPTRNIIDIGVQYDWHELFPKIKNNAGAVAAIWTPVTVVYFMDTQIWYSVFCTIFGGLYGILHHLGEIRTLGMLRSRFQSLPYAFNARLIPPPKNNRKGRRRGFLGRRFHKLGVPEEERNALAKFALMWNQIISKLRHEDLINNRELNLMTMMMPTQTEKLSGVVRWPVFLLANKVSMAFSMAKDFVGEYHGLFRKIRRDKNMHDAVIECFESLKYFLDILVVGDLEKRIIANILEEVELSIQKSSLLKNFRLGPLPALRDKCVELLELLLGGEEEHHSKVVKVLQDMFELVTRDMMVNGDRILDLLNNSQQTEGHTYFFERVGRELFWSADGQDSINFPLPDNSILRDQINRFYLLLTIKDTAMDLPSNIEARRRLSFFVTSLFMDMPCSPKVRNMLSFSVLTPHFMEDVNFSMRELHWSQEGVPIIFYMQRIYPDEWKNFLERVGYEDTEKDESKEEELRSWASFRGQTLSRTVRGMMYYREALRLQAFLEIAMDQDIIEGYDSIDRGNRELSAQLDALADLKFTYVVSCQMFGSQKASGDPHFKDVLDLMIRYPSLRVAYVEEKEEIVDVEGGRKIKKIYSSILVKAVNNFDQEIYRIQLPGPPIIGEGKPENQNHAIIFTRGEALQTIDMNQDNYLEEALKMRNLLQEFLQHNGQRPPTILGLREHIFTGSVSSLAWFMSYQETSFVTIGQRLLANPLRVRFHYGHPDIFDRVFHITRGGISKASKTINLSEDVFAGFNSTLRRGSITYHEYIQVGKGRDVGLNQISKFEAKVANGNSEQTISRDIYRLAQQFDFFRMLSCYFTTIGFYLSSLMSIIGIYVFLYGQLYLVLSGLAKALIQEANVGNVQSLETALASQSFIQLGLLTGLPMVMEIGLEKGFLMALKDFVLMQLQLASVFFTFSLGTKTHYFGRTILHGGAKYRPTGRKVVVFHASFSENYRLYSRSHFVKGFELLLLLVIYDLFRRSFESSMAYVLITYSVWFMSITWLFAPFLFNPSGFSWSKIVDDWKDWNKWIKVQGGIGVHPDKSWQSWWDAEQAHIHRSGFVARFIEVFLSLRFFLYQYGLVYHLDISQKSTNFFVYVLSWIVLLAIFLLVKAVNMGRQQFSARHQLVFRLFKVFLFLGVLSIIVTLSVVCKLSLKDIIVCCLAFLPTGWGLILIAQAARPKIENTGLWEFVRVLARAYDYGMGVILFAPVACLAWLPIISAFQTRFLFNEAFSRRLHIQSILAGKTKKHHQR
ncbi:hypothetical protein SAY86_004513 [Trapa natans]|uniref:1,3-beta-glucan synthase n=1 Tax=Trapa natans TaxID=22666 RepID=A0AAN7N4P0_TRANT|nr:hypothetical protein SAY86_004513 [Trapa natans]